MHFSWVKDVNRLYFNKMGRIMGWGKKRGKKMKISRECLSVELLFG
jgi:hypothetical protein